MESLRAKDVLGALFSLSAGRNGHVQSKWISLSRKLGSSLPVASIFTIQSIGNFDLILRALEEEFQPSPTVDLSLTLQYGLSASWIGNAYEVFRVAKNLRGDDIEAKEIHDLLLFLRVPLEKYQIAQEKHLKEPLVLGLAGGSLAETRIYDKKDDHRSFTIPSQISNRGSAEWLAVDTENRKQFWLDRLTLSDRILAYSDSL